MKYTTILIALISTIFSFGQRNDPNLRSGQMHSYNPLLSSNVNRFLDPVKNIKGSRFVFKDFKKQGTIYMGDQVFKVNGLNIDALNKDLVLRVGKDSILVIEKNKVDSIGIDSHHFKKFIDNGQFYEVLYENPHVSLLKMYDCQIKKGKVNVMKGTSENDSYKLSESYYLYQKKSLGGPFKLNQKTILNSLPDKQQKIKNYLKNNKLSLKREEDLIQLFKYLESQIDSNHTKL